MRDNDSLAITALKTDKSKIKITPNMKAGNVPCHPCSVLFCGRSGSGKTNLLIRLLTEKKFYKGYFDMVFVWSDTSDIDDLYDKHLKDIVPPEHRFKPDKVGIQRP